MTDTLATTTVDHPTIEEAPPDVPGGTAPQGATIDDDDADFAELPPKRRVPRITKVLLVGILVAAGFGGGVMIQKNFGASSATSPSSFPSFAGGLPTGGGGGGGGGASNNGSGQGSTAASGPVVVGTVVSVSGNDVTVKDLGGATHIVHVAATTGLATAGVDWSTSLKPGSTVSVNGTKADDGSVTATTVTKR
jgi:hypothetical protein